MDSRRMCPHCRAFITDKDRVCPYCNERVGARAVDRRGDAPILGGIIPHARFTTVVILLINFGLYLATVIIDMKNGTGNAVDLNAETLVNLGAKFFVLQSHQYWRLVTAGFLHGGMMHILFNSWALFDAGAQVEELYGTSRMLVIYFVGNTAGFYLSALWSPAVPSVGASAAICGLIGAMIALGLRHQNPMGAAIRGVYIRWAVYILIIGLLPGLRVDNAAHVGGLAAGMGIGYIAGTPRLNNPALETMWRAAAGFCILITVLCFLMMYLYMSQSAQ
jgi:rhomboid protease GluP